MTDITDEQRAAYSEVVAESLTFAAAWSMIAPLLPSELTNPQPVLPTEPGLYASHTDPYAAWKLHKDGEWWPPYQDYAVEIAEVHAAAPFTRLVPERPPITREQVGMAVVIANGYGGEMGARAWIDRLHAALAKVSNRD